MGVYCFDGIREGGDRILGLKSLGWNGGDGSSVPAKLGTGKTS